MDYEVIISGGGLNGITLALALNHAGISVAIIDKQARETLSSSDFTGRSYALSSASKKMLSALNVWPNLNSKAQPMLEIKVTDGSIDEKPSPFAMHFNKRDFNDGPMGFVVEDRHLRHALLKSLADTNVAYFHEVEIVKQTLNGPNAIVELNNETSLSTSILVGADGQNSRTAAAAGIHRIGWDYGQSSLVCAVEHEKPHNSIAYQHFLPAGPLAILPLSGNRSGIVWTEKSETASVIHNLKSDEYLDALLPRFGKFLGNISLVGSRYIYPLKLSTTHQMIDTRLALVGDAAHSVHPIAGQGLNAGFKDVAALAEILCETKRRGQDLGNQTTLEQYQHWRRFDNAMLSLVTNGVNNLFSNNNPITRTIRDLGLGLVNNNTILRQALVANAAGTSGDVPKLLRGQEL
jgi:2-octaprenyl-6-methoxyphenol hydroxylase|tara:strand:+ start:152 stop:1369 length:1218 start_codon:yes stop_codon:yes gene_type:complete